MADCVTEELKQQMEQLAGEYKYLSSILTIDLREPLPEKGFVMVYPEPPPGAASPEMAKLQEILDEVKALNLTREEAEPLIIEKLTLAGMELHPVGPVQGADNQQIVRGLHVRLYESFGDLFNDPPPTPFLEEGGADSCDIELVAHLPDGQQVVLGGDVVD